MPGLWSRLGSFGTKVIRSAQQLGQSLGEVLGIIKPVVPFVDPMAVAREWGKVSTFDALTPDVAKLGPDELVPRDLFVTRDVPWRGRFAYEVSIYGRNLATGQFARWKYNMQANRELTIQEVNDEARLNIGRKGRSPKLEIWDVTVTGAWRSAEVEW